MPVETRNFGGWPDCAWLSNGDVELVIPAAIGPRVMRYGFAGGQNLFHNYPHALGKSGEPTWQNRGGHRLWAAPEDKAITYALDNGPVQLKADSLSVVATATAPADGGFRKEMEIQLAPRGSRVTILHRLTNNFDRPVRCAAWALSVMRPGGTAIAGFPPRARHDERLLPTNPLVMWGYTDFSDARWRFTKRFLLLRQDPQATYQQKTGLFAEDSWAAYSVGGELFVKRARAFADAEYPDFGCSLEIFTNPLMLEVETLGPLVSLPPGGSIEHVEHWGLHRAPELGGASDEELAQTMASLWADQ